MPQRSVHTKEQLAPRKYRVGPKARQAILKERYKQLIILIDGLSEIDGDPQVDAIWQELFAIANRMGDMIR